MTREKIFYKICDSEMYKSVPILLMEEDEMKDDISKFNEKLLYNSINLLNLYGTIFPLKDITKNCAELTSLISKVISKDSNLYIYSFGTDNVFTEIKFEIVSFKKLTENDIIDFSTELYEQTGINLFECSYAYDFFIIRNGNCYKEEINENVIIKKEELFNCIKEKINIINSKILDKQREIKQKEMDIVNLNESKKSFLEMLTPEDRLLFEISEED